MKIIILSINNFLSINLDHDMCHNVIQQKSYQKIKFTHYLIKNLKLSSNVLSDTICGPLNNRDEIKFMIYYAIIYLMNSN